MEVKSRYIDADMFKQYTGIDLSLELKTDDNPSNQVDALLYRVESRMASFIASNFYRNIDNEFKRFSDYQKEHYKIALLEQVLYILKNGDLSVDSGYNPQEGIKTARRHLERLSIAPNAVNELRLCGVWCRHIKNRSRGAIDGLWWY